MHKGHGRSNAKVGAGHVVETQQFDRETIEKLFKLADSLEGVREESLKGKIMAALFYEPSTRTRLSFESAMLHLGGSVITMENGSESSSATKGETLEDSTRVVNHYADVIVMRHPEAGASARAAAVSKVPVINAGDGAGQHPTQSLLDLYTIRRELGRTDDIRIAFVGDLKYGRAARSLGYLLAKFKNIHMTFVSSEALKMGDDIKTYLKKHKVTYDETEKFEDAMHKCDVMYQTRIQKERFASQEEYQKFKGVYIINRKLADSMKKGAIIIHPLPRVGEITPEVDDSPHAVYFKQVGYGLLIRMALLKTILGGRKMK
ncbi:aspartate carbamoyltransferase [Candidatus Kaiserbacteria bacterium RIFCSPHIGHO2_12_FULL_53_13]|uniref:Aspartate carbamoyltransferase n=1 Tax=Candidatus Kaiserbacteria bacterium RIFCSPHIGHO2_12_FULL_53_13 TaxID=1798502 RepID=A0A1F6ECA0_9BACT|nr:MAG: aspartate carbamoyltransferase [Candidatus Kaiserbacteria bacterium RIFCSPHIGHO2_12_FULL_53_13]OGG74316.1 MAG: aspartate carbamoyltransferase [Candidatus Kaiserbacteria bacterium RIFCSPLOWO2_01_FULL_52_36]